MLLDDISESVKVALKKRDVVVVETLRFLVSEVKNEAIRKYGAEAHRKITDEDVMAVIKKQVKTHRESVDAFEKAGRTELAEKENAQLTVLKTYLPEEITDDELRGMIEPIAAQGGDFGPMMGKAMAAVKGRAEGSRVSAMLRSLTK